MKNGKNNNNFCFIYRLVAFLSIFLFSGAVLSHNDETHTISHENYDAFIANIARENEQSRNAVFARYFDQTIENLHIHALFAELVDATLGKQANAVVGGNPALYGQWSGLTTWPFVFASAANLPDGRILAWGGNNPTTFNGGTFTYAAIWDPKTNQFTNVNHPTHSLFCGVPVMLEDGRVFVSGGDSGNASSVKGTSTFNATTQTWTRIQDLAVGRWYNGSVYLPNGKVFVALGEAGSAYPEIWTEGAGWSYLNGSSLQSAVLDFPTVTEPKNWLPHLHLSPNGKIFHSGHTPQINSIDPTGNGSVQVVGLTNDWNTANTPSILYDEGKILQSGGALYSDNTSSKKSQLFDLNSSTPVRTINTNMQFPRIFHNEVVLPNGEVMAIGGNAGVKFSDEASQFTPEIWNPISKTWRSVADISVGRNYHSVALLMNDGRVWSGGGGLCGCSADHPDSQIFSPPYLFNPDGSLASRPQIIQAPGLVSYGAIVNVTASSGINRFSLIRMSSTTHALNSDMRFLNVPFVSNGNGQYTLTFHGNRDVMVPGYWMLFALDSAGVPSVAKIIKVSTSNSPVITNPGDQSSVQNTNTGLALQAVDPNGDQLTFSAVGLPTGLTINPATGVISGVANTLGNFRVVFSVSDNTNTVTTSITWNITTNQLPQSSSIFGAASGTAFTDSIQANQSLTGVNIHSGWWLDSIQGLLNTGALAPHGGTGGTVINITWPTNEYLVRIYGLYGTYVGQISFVTNTGRVLGPYGSALGGTNTSSFDYTVPAGREIVGFTGRASTYLNSIGVVYRNRIVSNQPPVLTSIPNQANKIGDTVNVSVLASDPDGDSLSYSAVGLPNGVTINSVTGVISGTPTVPATTDVTIQVNDVRGASAAINFQWAIISPLVLNPINTQPRAINTAITFKATVTNSINPRFKWSFGDNSSETAYSIDPTAQHSYTDPGLKVVKLTVTDDSGVEIVQSFIQAISLPVSVAKPNSSANMAISTTNSVNRLWVVNQDNDSVSLFNTDTDVKIKEIAVGKAPRAIAIAPDGRVWVTNKGDSSISIIDPLSTQVQQSIQLPIGSQPFGLVFAPDKSAGYLVLEGTGKLLKLNPADGSILASLDVGANPRHVAITRGSSRVLVSRFITKPLPGENTATIQTTDPVGNKIGGEVITINPNTMVRGKIIVLQHSDKEDTENKGAGVPNYLATIGISPDGINAWLPSKQDNIKRGNLRSANNLNFQNTVRAIASKINLTTLTENYDARIDFDNSGVVSAVTFDRSGSYMFAALETSREVSVVDAYGGRELRRIPVGLAPEGLALSPNGQKLYVNNFMDRTVSVIDLSKLLSRGEWLAPVIRTLSSVTTEKLPTQVLKGKQLFYDAKDLRLASDSYLSCASCHNDAGHDGRVWDLTGFGEGLRNTIDLRGRQGVGQGLLHWSANFDEVQDFEGQIRSLAGGTGLLSEVDFARTKDTLGIPKAGLSADLDALAAYLGSLSSFQTSPYRNANGTLTAPATVGKTLFVSTGCVQCHGGSAFTDSPSHLVHDVGTIKPTTGKRLNATLTGLDVPTLRDVWNTAPYLHDGSALTIQDAIRAHNTNVLTDTEVNQLTNYVRQIGGSEAAAPNQQPSIVLTAPNNGSSFVQGTGISLSANASDTDGSVVKVEFYSGSNLLTSVQTAPYSFNWTGAAAGTYLISAKAYDNYGLVSVSPAVSITEKPLVRQGLLGQYFNSVDLTGTSVLQRSEAVNFDWAAGSPGAGVGNDNFSVRWSGQVIATNTGSYQFRTSSDDGVRLYVNGVLQINNWTDHAAADNTTNAINLVAGNPYNITMEYYERGGDAVAKLLWLPPGQFSFSTIPVSQLINSGN